MKSKLIMLILFLVSFNIFSKDISLKLDLSVSEKKLKELKNKKQFNINELQYILTDNIDKWVAQGDTLGITCQAVTPMGKWIGSFDNPDFTGKSNPGGQSETCNLWLVQRENEQPEDDNEPKQPNKNYPFRYQIPTQKYFAL